MLRHQINEDVKFAYLQRSSKNLSFPFRLELPTKLLIDYVPDQKFSQLLDSLS